MDLDRDLAESEFRGDLLVQLTGGDERHDFALARRQRVEAFPHVAGLCSVANASTARRSTGRTASRFGQSALMPHTIPRTMAQNSDEMAMPPFVPRRVHRMSGPRWPGDRPVDQHLPVLQGRRVDRILAEHTLDHEALYDHVHELVRGLPFGSIDPRDHQRDDLRGRQEGDQATEPTAELEQPRPNCPSQDRCRDLAPARGGWRTILSRIGRPAGELERLAIPIVVTSGTKGASRPYSFFYAKRIVREARRAAGLPEHVSMTACRHGGMSSMMPN